MKGEAVTCCIRNLLDRDFQDSSRFVGIAQRFCHSRVGSPEAQDVRAGALCMPQTKYGDGKNRKGKREAR
jgi:hypothetical protein